MKALKGEGAKLGDPAYTTLLLDQWGEYYPVRFNLWKAFTKACLDHEITAFKKEALAYLKTEVEALSYANYFKNQGLMSQLTDKPLGGDLKNRAHAILKS